MDEQDVYASAKEPSGPQVKWEGVKSSENIQNEDECCSVETDRTGPALSALQRSSTVRSCSYRASTVILGLLCLLLLVGLITVCVLYNESSSTWETKKIQLQTNYNNLTEEKDQLQASYNNLTEEKDQLQTSYNDLTVKKDQLQEHIYDQSIERQLETLDQSYLVEERDELRKKLDDFIYHSQYEWIYFSGSFYYISSITATWQQSRSNCQQKNADLIVINSKKEQDFFNKFSKAMWIGLTDRVTEGVWRWVDDTPLTRSFWGSGEPNSFFGIVEDCAVIGYHSGEDSWNDVACGTEYIWICEKTTSL